MSISRSSTRDRGGGRRGAGTPARERERERESKISRRSWSRVHSRSSGRRLRSRGCMPSPPSRSPARRGLEASIRSEAQADGMRAHTLAALVERMSTCAAAMRAPPAGTIAVTRQHTAEIVPRHRILCTVAAEAFLVREDQSAQALRLFAQKRTAMQHQPSTTAESHPRWVARSAVCDRPRATSRSRTRSPRYASFPPHSAACSIVERPNSARRFLLRGPVEVQVRRS